MKRQYLTFFLLALGILCIAPLNCSACTTLVDVYTQYPPPWGGQGLNMASDTFLPNGIVKLETNVTFRGDGIPDKPVAYTIKAPNGTTFYSTAFTQANGIAVLEFSLPSSENCFGMWTVEANVDIGGTIVSDTLHFLVSWLVEVGVNAPPIAYKGRMLNVNVALTRICAQDPKKIMNMLLKDPCGKPITDNDLLLCITVNDELKQFVAASYLKIPMITELGVDNLNNYVQTMGEQWKNHQRMISTQYPELAIAIAKGILISARSFSGKATIHAYLVTKCSGIAYSPGGLGFVWIKRG